MRPLFAVAGWIAAAAAAIGIGLVGVQAIGNGITTGPGGQVLTAEEAARQLAAAGPVPASSPAASPAASPTSSPFSPSAGAASPAPSAPPAPDQPVNVRAFAGTGGTVVAGCLPAGAYLVNWSSAQGYGVKEARRGPGEYAEVRFDPGGGGKGNGESRVRVRCTGDVPAATWN